MKKQHSTTHHQLRVGMISLGCAKNLVDAEIMLGTLIKDGIEITNEAAEADVVIVNTCSFIDAAQEESVDTILESAEVREAHHRGQALVVSGCLPQRFRDRLPKLLPEVDAFIGIDQVADISKTVRQALAARRQRLEATVTAPGPDPTEARPDASVAKRSQPKAPAIDVHVRPKFIPDFATPRFRLTPRHFAYVKIAEGCNHPCSFCIIPRMRGTHRSRTLDDVTREARQLIADGVKELNLISQDSTYYGMDLRPNHRRSISSPEKFSVAVAGLADETPTLCTLLRELNELDGDFWIRILYTHPAHWTDELIETISQCSKVARYVDIPLQHIHHNMLERMRRETSREHIVDLIERIRTGIPGIAIRTTFIVGFPGETDACFQELLDFIQATRFERLGVFAYSHEEGTKAANMENQISDPLKKQRREQAMATQHEIAKEVSITFVGRSMKVLVDSAADEKEWGDAAVSSWEHGLMREGISMPSEPTGKMVVARGEADAPDIDGRVFVKGELPVGEFAEVKVVGCSDYDLIAQPV